MGQRMRYTRARALLAVALLVLAHVSADEGDSQSAAAEEGWTMPTEPQEVVPNSESMKKYAKKIIWVDEAEPEADANEESPLDLTSLRYSLAESMLNTLDRATDIDAFALPIAKGREQSTSLHEGHYFEDALVKKNVEETLLDISHASASSSESYESRPDLAFDSNMDTVWVSKPWHPDDRRPQWIEYAFDKPVALNRYSLASYSALDQERQESAKQHLSMSRLGGAVFGGPTAWILKCSQEGITWKELHNVRQSQPWIPGEVRQYVIADDTPWNYCRVEIHSVPARPDGNMQVALSEITFTEADPTRIQPTRIALSNNDEFRASMPTQIQSDAAGNDECSFPFMHADTLRYECIPFQGKSWCKDRKDSWLVCKAGSTGGSSVAQDVSMVTKTDAGGLRSLDRVTPKDGILDFQYYDDGAMNRQCQFPFLHFGALHDACVPFQGKNWCKDQQEKWLVCSGNEGSAASVPTQSEQQSASNAVGGEDWYIEFTKRNTMNSTFNVLELKPTAASASAAVGGGPAGIKYEVCKTTGLDDFELYLPSRYTNLPLGDDDAAHVALPENFTFPFYGQTYEDIFVGANGYITFDEADTNYMPDEESHFGKRRISALFTDVDTSRGGEVHFANLGNAVVVTWTGVTLREPQSTNNGDASSMAASPTQQPLSFQVILFKDGTIWMGYEDVQSSSAVVGLSTGQQSKTSGRSKLDVATIKEC